MTRHSHQVFDSKGSKRGVLQRLADAVGLSDGSGGVKVSAQASDVEPSEPPPTMSAEPSTTSSETTSTSSPSITSAAQPASIPADGSADIPEKGSDEFPPLEIVTNGRTAWVKTDEVLSTAADVARLFLLWVAKSYPECAGKTISVPDIERHFFPRFKAGIGCPSLPLGTLLRGLTDLSDYDDITDKREERYKDWRDGKRRSRTTYLVPHLPTAVVDLAKRRKAS